MFQARLKLEGATAPGNANQAEEDCEKAKTTSAGKDSYTFTCNADKDTSCNKATCDADKAASKIFVKTSSYDSNKNLAEIIVAGHEWGE